MINIDDNTEFVELNSSSCTSDICKHNRYRLEQAEILIDKYESLIPYGYTVDGYVKYLELNIPEVCIGYEDKLAIARHVSDTIKDYLLLPYQETLVYNRIATWTKGFISGLVTTNNVEIFVLALRSIDLYADEPTVNHVISDVIRMYESEIRKYIR